MPVKRGEADANRWGCLPKARTRTTTGPEATPLGAIEKSFDMLLLEFQQIQQRFDEEVRKRKQQGGDVYEQASRNRTLLDSDDVLVLTWFAPVNKQMGLGPTLFMMTTKAFFYFFLLMTIVNLPVM